MLMKTRAGDLGDTQEEIRRHGRLGRRVLLRDGYDFGDGPIVATHVKSAPAPAVQPQIVASAVTVRSPEATIRNDPAITVSNQVIAPPGALRSRRPQLLPEIVGRTRAPFDRPRAGTAIPVDTTDEMPRTENREKMDRIIGRRRPLPSDEAMTTGSSSSDAPTREERMVTETLMPPIEPGPLVERFTDTDLYPPRPITPPFHGLRPRARLAGGGVSGGPEGSMVGTVGVVVLAGAWGALMLWLVNDAKKRGAI
jgi:hypothetical protein